MLGYTRDDLPAGRIDWIELTPPELRARDSQPIADLYAMGKHLPFEKQYLRKDGARVPILVASAFNEGSQNEGVGFVVDITAQKQAEKEAQEKGQDIVTIFESITDAFFALDARWQFTYLNTEAERLLRRTSDELIGCPFTEGFPDTLQGAFGRRVRRGLRKRGSADIEGFYPPFNAWFEVCAFPSRTGLSVYFRDMTGRKQAEQDRERLVGELQEAGIRQRRFLKEMLSSFTEGRLQLCFTAEDLPSRLSSPTDIVELSPHTVRVLRKQAEAVAVNLNMPAGRVYDLATAIGESAMNAVRHGGGGSGSVSASRDKSIVQVWIQDQGKGIREEDLRRATLEKGWSGANSFGHGFSLMIKAVDRTYLLTGAEGTTIVLEQEVSPPEPAWLQRVNDLQGG